MRKSYIELYTCADSYIFTEAQIVFRTRCIKTITRYDGTYLVYKHYNDVKQLHLEHFIGYCQVMSFSFWISLPCTGIQSGCFGENVLFDLWGD